MIHRFGEFELDEERRELPLHGRERLLQPRVFDLLAYLVRRPERVVGKDELLEALWPEVTVTEGPYARGETEGAITALRLATFLAALGDRPAAEIELGTVETIYSQRKLPALLERCAVIRTSLGA